MKEAAGEANMTVVTIILIAAIVAVATPIITSMMGNFGKRACCMDAGGYWSGSSCKEAKGGADISIDSYWDKENNRCKND